MQRRVQNERNSAFDNTPNEFRNIYIHIDDNIDNDCNTDRDNNDDADNHTDNSNDKKKTI